MNIIKEIEREVDRIERDAARLAGAPAPRGPGFPLKTQHRKVEEPMDFWRWADRNGFGIFMAFVVLCSTAIFITGMVTGAMR